MNYLIRYADLKHSGDLYEDYRKSGFANNQLQLSKKGIRDLEGSISKVKNLHFKKIYCSESTGSIQSAEYLASTLDLNFEIKDCLNGIKHDFSNLITRSKFNSNSSDTMDNMRKNFIQQFLNDELVESKKDIIDQLNQITNLFELDQNILLISHGTTLKLLNLYLLSDSKINNLILDLTNFTQPFYSSLSGFKSPDLTDINFC